MNILWTDEALDDLEEILVYYHSEAGPLTAEAVHSRIVAEIEALRVFPERIRASTRIPGARELVVRRLPYVAFVKVTDDAVIVLNVFGFMANPAIQSLISNAAGDTEQGRTLTSVASLNSLMAATGGGAGAS